MSTTQDRAAERYAKALLPVLQRLLSIEERLRLSDRLQKRGARAPQARQGEEQEGGLPDVQAMEGQRHEQGGAAPQGREG